MYKFVGHIADPPVITELIPLNYTEIDGYLLKFGLEINLKFQTNFQISCVICEKNKSSCDIELFEKIIIIGPNIRKLVTSNKKITRMNHLDQYFPWCEYRIVRSNFSYNVSGIQKYLNFYSNFEGMIYY